MNSIILRGIASGNPTDDRTKLVIDIGYNNEIFPWEVRVHPTYTGSFDEYLIENEERLYGEVESKLQEWEELDPKERTIESPFGDEESIVVPITREEIVTPTYPDYYVLRSREYPPLAEQMDAFWKGGENAEAMHQKIIAVKEKYPK
jgi:hypothetical protein